MKNSEGCRLSKGRPRKFDREKALVNALELFWEQGYQQTTMIQLCQKMGINSPSLYCAFGNKANLFIEALVYYRKKYWQPLFDNFLNSDNLFEASRILFRETAKTLLLPDAPCGCLTVFSAMTLPLGEEEILKTVSEMRRQTKGIFSDRLQKAVEKEEIASDCDIPVIAGALTNFFEGLTLQARGNNQGLAELTDIALSGLQLLPPEIKKDSVPKRTESL